MGIMALYWWIDQGLLYRLIAKDNRYEIGFRYVIVKWISNWEGTVQILVDVLNWLLSLVLGRN